MLTYSKALELKNAGFPPPELENYGDRPIIEGVSTWTILKTFGQAYYKNSSIPEERILQIFPGWCYNPECVYIPTLSELIEECGEEWQVLWKRDDGYISKSWKEDTRKENYHEAKGLTPEEAVANLYLALHK